TKIVHACNSIGKSYLKFRGEINPKEIQIPIPPSAQDINNVMVGTGLYYSPDSNKVYSAFISPQTAAPRPNRNALQETSSAQANRNTRNIIQEASVILTYD